MKRELPLMIAGERMVVLFDGKRVTDRMFDSIPMEFTARCGTRITQEMLVEICKRKIEEGR